MGIQTHRKTVRLKVRLGRPSASGRYTAGRRIFLIILFEYRRATRTEPSQTESLLRDTQEDAHLRRNQSLLQQRQEAQRKAMWQKKRQLQPGPSEALSTRRVSRRGFVFCFFLVEQEPEEHMRSRSWPRIRRCLASRGRLGGGGGRPQRYVLGVGMRSSRVGGVCF